MLFCIPENNELPRLLIVRGRSLIGRVKDRLDLLVRDRFVRELPYAVPAVDIFNCIVHNDIRCTILSRINLKILLSPVCPDTIFAKTGPNL